MGKNTKEALQGENAKLWEFCKKAYLKRRRQYLAELVTTITNRCITQSATEFNAMGQAIASMNQYQQMGNTEAIAILQIKEKEQAFKAGVARIERAKARLNPSDANVAMITLKSSKTSPCQERTSLSLLRRGTVFA